MSQLLPNHKIFRIKRILIYTFISILITALIIMIRYRYDISAINDIELILFFGIAFGFMLGSLDDFMLYSKISKWSYKYRTLLKVVIIPIILLLLFFIIAFLRSSKNSHDVQIGDGDIILQFIDLLNSSAILDIFILAFFITLFNEINLILGDNFMMEYLSGNFKGPIKEDRIFMFLDLKDSTTIAEQIGDIKFYELLNDCYTLLGSVSVPRKAEIVKYVGDEAILTWTYGSKKNTKNCIELFYDYKNLLEKHQNYFKDKYNLQPRFTAAAHHGSVISAYLGSVKRQKDYSGDVMNTTARIEGMTTKYNAEFLISEDLFDKLEMKDHEGEKIESIPLKGKAEPINIYKLS